VSPYSWTYPGGVTRHIEALAGEFTGSGHDVRILAPYDPPDRLAVRMHGGARPQVRDVHPALVPLGRTLGLRFNGAVSNASLSPAGISALRSELATGGYDVVHLHEPVVPCIGWDAMLSVRTALVGTFHTYGENPFTHNLTVAGGVRRRMNRLHVRLAVSEAAEWTARRFFGGAYRIVPNGVELGPEPGPRSVTRTLRIVFVGQVVERKGLPILLRAFEALREHVPASLTIVGADEAQVAPLLFDARGVRVLGKVSDEVRREELAHADVLVAPSLGGESFGMVLTEAFAAGTPVVASDIAGYRDVVSPGCDGVLVPRGDGRALAEALRDLADDPARRAAMGTAARESARRYAWPRVADEILASYEEAREVAAVPASKRVHRAALRAGALPASGERVPSFRGPAPEPPLPGRRSPALVAARRVAVGIALVLGAALALVAVRRIGLDRVARSLIDSSPAWVLAGLGLMCLSMATRAVAWHAILRAALPRARVKLADALQGTSIGVLMSATLPARLGEPSRALIVARRTGRPRDNLPVVLGTIVSQTLLNLVALGILGVVMFESVGLFHGHHRALWLASLGPLVLVIVVLLAPALLARGGTPRSERLHRLVAQGHAALSLVRTGLAVFRKPGLGGLAAVAQLTAWAIQWLACYVLLVALGLQEQAGIGAAAAVLFAVNVTAALPATPSNVGIFQAACVAVLHGAYGVGAADALGYGIVLQAVEIATAVAMGAPALVKEGLSWRDVKLRALHASPVTLAARADGSAVAEAEA